MAAWTLGRWRMHFACSHPGELGAGAPSASKIALGRKDERESRCTVVRSPTPSRDAGERIAIVVESTRLLGCSRRAGRSCARGLA